MSDDACTTLARRDVLLLRTGGEVLEVVVFRRLSVVGRWGDPETGSVSSVRVSLVHNVPSSRGVAGACGVCTSEAPCGLLTVNLGMRADVVQAGAVGGSERLHGDWRAEPSEPETRGSTPTTGSRLL